MAWYEQLDLDFGSITDQFTDLIGEASTLLENANNLDILNLDAMAVQEELAEALEEEDGLEYEDENEVIYHDQEHVEDESQPEVVHHYEESAEQDEQQHNSHAHFSTPDRHSSYAQPHDHISVSVPSTATKQLHFVPDTEHIEGTAHTQAEEDTPEDEAPTEGLDDSFAWDAMDNKTPKKSTKLLSQIRNFNNSSGGSGTGANGVDSAAGNVAEGCAGADSTGGADTGADTAHTTATVIENTSTDTSAFTIEDTGRHITSPARNTNTSSNTAINTSATKPSSKAANNTGATTIATPHTTTSGTSVPNVPGKSTGTSSTSTVKPKPLPKDTITSSNTAGRKARPLKPKPKVSKEFDFWGVNSTKKTLNFPTASVGGGSSSGKGGGSGSSGVGGGSVGGGGSGGGVSGGSGGTGVGGVNTDSSAASTHSTEHFYSVVGLFGDDYITDNTEPDIESNTPNPTTSTDTSSNANTATHHSRLPLGWLSNIIPTTDTTPSYFDDIEYDSEDPILKQVELNKSNPYTSGESNVEKLWSMWESMVGDDTTDTNTSTSSTNPNTNTGASTSGKPNLSIFIPVVTPGVGPVWVVAGLNWLKYLTGVTLIVLSSGSGGNGGSNGSGGDSIVYSADTRTEPNTHYPNWNIFTVRLTQPADYTYKPLLLFTLYILRLLLIILVSVLLRIVVFVFKLISMCVVYVVSYLRTTRLGSRVSSGSARLRSFFSNERVNNVLGGEAPADQSWVQQTQESLRAWTSFGYEQMNSTNAIMLLTAGLFVYSYFKFQRYGTDAGA